jgi:hypothetical protein
VDQLSNSYDGMRAESVDWGLSGWEMLVPPPPAGREAKIERRGYC